MNKIFCYFKIHKFRLEAVSKFSGQWVHFYKCEHCGAKREE